MKRNRFTDEPLMFILHEHEACALVSELWRKHGVSDLKFGGMDVSEANRLLGEDAEAEAASD